MRRRQDGVTRLSLSFPSAPFLFLLWARPLGTQTWGFTAPYQECTCMLLRQKVCVLQKKKQERKNSNRYIVTRLPSPNVIFRYSSTISIPYLIVQQQFFFFFSIHPSGFGPSGWFLGRFTVVPWVFPSFKTNQIFQLFESSIGKQQ